MSTTNARLVLVVVGTDHHPFDRVVGWADEWAASHPDLRVLVQYGTSRPPTTAEGRDLLPVGELTALMSEATAVVCHGGPGTIMGAREAGHVPIVVPRRSDLGEHVDDHQVRFATRVAAAGQVHLATDQPTFSSLLERADAGRRVSGSIWRPRIRRPRPSPRSRHRWTRCWRGGVARGVNALGPRRSCGRATASIVVRGRVGSDRFSRGTGDGNAPARGAEGSANRCVRPHARRRTMPSRATLRRSRSRRLRPPPRRRWRCDRGWRPGASRMMYRHRASAPEAGPGGSVRFPGRLSLSAVARGSPFGLSFAP